MQVQAKDLDAGDTIKVGGSKHTVTGTAQRGGHTDLTLTAGNGRINTLTCDSATRFIRVDPLIDYNAQ